MPARVLEGRIRARFKRHGVSADAAQIQQLGFYLGLLAKWNKTVNLTSLELDPPSDVAIDRLLTEPFVAARLLVSMVPGVGTSVLPAPAAGETTAERLPILLDIGSGGGSPAIPLRIALPGLRLWMVEAKARKSAFLREAIRQLSMTGAEVLTARLEELLARPELHEAADMVSLRAVRADQRLWNTISAFTKPGAFVLWFRTQADAGRVKGEVFFPAFLLDAVRALIPGQASELAILRKPR